VEIIAICYPAIGFVEAPFYDRNGSFSPEVAMAEFPAAAKIRGAISSLLFFR
jgi:hypothetical protein